MIKYQCKTCLGEYENTDKDGIQYFHACAPVIDTPAQIDSKTGLPKTPATYKERTDKRDENIKLDSTGKSAGMKADAGGKFILEQ